MDREARVIKRPHSTWEIPHIKEKDDEIKKAARDKRLKKAMQLSKHDVVLSQEERYSLAQMIPGIDKDDGGSWAELTAHQLDALIWMLEGYIWITYMKSIRYDDWTPEP